ncbi:hypothetical protein [Mucilaginibacter polytrichastri]|uniref:Lin1244/Lin1753-like N-terminal domain-containing protein n=1 Tax=Mucilaginibacter polytrichastri TaxID=1302689 RepID=A0A1Q5ZV70_9SPHI|nr:hypothetical protein [Mucilaginibacter polytrichastri]OKS85679.1 hypothetical protein RG47T_1125 [Mucilaginibacter polytrichastri]SFS62071.1 hypothetical protein SAMN04487890_102452 [Mucilaginibacter polytrichastri]
MDRSKPLSDFFTAIEKDGRIGITHIGIYAALLKYRIDKGFVNPIYVFRRDIMHIAKISWPNTFYKCVNDLSEYGYIKYEASFNKNEGSRIYFPD